MECLKFMKDLSRFSNHVLKNKTFVGKVFMDHSKACDCIPCDLLIAKLHAYCLFICTYIYIYIYIFNYGSTQTYTKLKNLQWPDTKIF